MTARLIQMDGSVKVWELNGSGDEARIEAMLELYARSFPQYAHYVPRMRQRAKFGEQQRLGHIVHYWLVEVDGQPAGLRTFRYIRTRNCGIAIALAVDPTFRKVSVNGHKLSMFLVHSCLDQIIADAEKLGAPPAWGMVNEVEFPRLMEYYKHHGIQELPIKYLEPIFPAKLQANEAAPIHFRPATLGLLPNPKLGERTYDTKNVADFALAFLVDHYGLPVDHPQVQAVLNSIHVIS